MEITPINLSEDLAKVEDVANKAFSVTPDSSLEEWFSFDEMKKNIESGRGVCLKAIENNEIVGMIYAQQESPINGKEGLDKWVIAMAAVVPETTGKGIGSQLLTELEKAALVQNASKMFVYTNKDDKKVINFYKKNGYEDAGWIKDYQYGKDNTPVFLLKYIK